MNKHDETKKLSVWEKNAYILDWNEDEDGNLIAPVSAADLEVSPDASARYKAEQEAQWIARVTQAYEGKCEREGKKPSRQISLTNMIKDVDGGKTGALRIALEQSGFGYLLNPLASEGDQREDEPEDEYVDRLNREAPFSFPTFEEWCEPERRNEYGDPVKQINLEDAFAKLGYQGLSWDDSLRRYKEYIKVHGSDDFVDDEGKDLHTYEAWKAAKDEAHQRWLEARHKDKNRRKAAVREKLASTTYPKGTYHWPKGIRKDNITRLDEAPKWIMTPGAQRTKPLVGKTVTVRLNDGSEHTGEVLWEWKTPRNAMDRHWKGWFLMTTVHGSPKVYDVSRKNIASVKWRHSAQDR